MYRLLIMFFATVPAVGGDPPRGRGVLFPRGKDTKGLPKGGTLLKARCLFYVTIW